MSDFRRVVSAPIVYVPVFSIRFALRFAFCVLLTALDAGVVALFGRALYRATGHHPAWFVGVSLLFAALFGSLIRVWTLMLRGQSR